MTQIDLSQMTAVGHSADVQMELHIGGQTFPVLQSGNAEIKVRDNQALPCGDARLIISVDGRPHEHLIRIVAPIPENLNWLAIEQR